MARGYNNRKFSLLILFILIGIVIGGLIGQILGNYIPILKFGYDIGVTPHTWNLIALKLTFGFMFKINIFSVMGIILAIIVYKRM